MAKKSFKLVKASAALAVTAAALTPVMAAEASTSTVELKAEVVLGGKFKEALALNTPKGVEIKWGKYLVTAINKWQTVKGQGSDGKTYIKKLYARNYPLYIFPQDLGEVEAGSELEKPSIRVMYRDGKVYTQAPERYTMSSTYNTKDEGEQKVLISYNHNGNRITSFLTYTVVASEVAFSNVASSVDQASEVLSVTADVKNLKEGEKVELVVYAGRDMNAALPAVPAVVKDGKVSVSSKLPAGDHSFILRSGDVKTEVVNFTVEAPMVKEVKAINANEVLITFNKELVKADAENEVNYTVNGKVLAGVDTATLQADKKSVVVKFDTTGAGVLENAGASSKVDTANDGLLDNNRAYTVAVAAGIDFVNGKELESAVLKTLTFVDNVKPNVTNVQTLENGDVKISVSERFKTSGSSTVVINGQNVSLTGAVFTDDTYNGYVTIPKANVDAATTLTSGQNYSIVVAGLEDLVGNEQNFYNGSFTYNVVNGAPVVKSITPNGEGRVTVEFSEALLADLVDNATVKVFKGNTQLTLAAINDVNSDNKKFDLVLPTGTNALYDSGDSSETLRVVVEGYKDVVGNIGQKVEQTVVVTKDATKPSVEKVEHTTVAGPTNDTLVVTLSEVTTAKTATQLATAGLYIIDQNGVRYDVDAAADFSNDLAGDTTDKSFTINTDSVNLGLGNGNYTLYVPANVLTDQALDGGNGNASQSVAFAITDAQMNDSVKPTVATNGVVETATRGQLAVTFSEAVKGGNVAGSATLASNYKLNGSALPAGATITLDGTRRIATITFPAGTFPTSAVRVLSISNVQDLASNTIESVDRTVQVTDNTAPVLTAAKAINSTELELTFSEKMSDAVALNFADFEVTVNGINVTEAVGVTAASANNKFVISVSDANLATGTIQVKVANTADATDFAGNALVTGTSVSATR